MARYGATRYAKASYSEVYDLHTEVGKTTLLGIHTPVTNRWQQFLGGFCQQFKRFRYKGASLSFVPVTTLPADPLQVSYEAGEPTIDPRDLMNPIIHCGMRGQDMGSYLDEVFRMNISDRLTSLDVVNYSNDNQNIMEELERVYYTALSSPQFRKSHVQQGFRKSGLHPMVYDLVTTRPFAYAGPEFIDNNGGVASTVRPTVALGSAHRGTAEGIVYTGGQGEATGSNLVFQEDFGGQGVWEPNNYDTAQFLTNKLSRLGWFDTIQRYSKFNTSLGGDYTTSCFTGLPKVYMYFIMLPPAYKQEMYFRVVIRHYFEFSGFKTLYGPFSLNDSIYQPYDGPIQNDPVEQSVMMNSIEPDIASLDVYNGEATLLSDGAM